MNPNIYTAASGPYGGGVFEIPKADIDWAANGNKQNNKRSPRRKKRTVICGIQFRGNAFAAFIQYLLMVVGIGAGIVALLEWQWHTLSEPTSVYLQRLTYLIIIATLYYIGRGINDLIKRRNEAVSVFFMFLLYNVLFALSAIAYYLADESRLEILFTWEKVVYWIFVFILCFFTFGRLLILEKNNSDGVRSSVFRLYGNSIAAFLAYFMRSLFVPIIVAAVFTIGNFAITPVWRAIFCIYAFLWAGDLLRMALRCNMRQHAYSNLSQFFYMQFQLLFLPALGWFIMWYFNWLPMPVWVILIYMAYSLVWMFATYGAYIQARKERNR